MSNRIRQPCQSRLLSALPHRHFYAVLVPLTLPVTLAAVFCKWFTIKMFKHA